MQKNFGGEVLEKFKPTYNLEEFKNSDFEITKTVTKTASEIGFDDNKIHPETGEVLHRDIREVEYEYKGEKIKIQQPAWYNDRGDDGIFTSEDWKIADQAYEILKARHAAKLQENDLDFSNAAFA